MECKLEANKSNCTCSNTACSRHGICCDCIKSHLAKRQLPGCCFPKDSEASKHRSFEKFAELVTDGKV